MRHIKKIQKDAKTRSSTSRWESCAVTGSMDQLSYFDKAGKSCRSGAASSESHPASILAKTSVRSSQDLTCFEGDM